MCGINGIVSTASESKQAIIKQMNLQLAHRGPDADNVWQNGKLVFGHRRLSIIDLSTSGSQPMISNDDTLSLVFNGELYNYGNLKAELKAKGYHFNTASDTEVVLYAYKEWGVGAFSRFNGMFAIVIYDKLSNKVVLARDHAGMKPLYYHLSDKELIFSSEIRGFKAYDPNWPANNDWHLFFLSLGFIPFPYTTLLNVYSLPKGHAMSIDLSDLTSNLAGFNNFGFTKDITDENTALKLVRKSLLEAVDRHMIADVPLGIFLSGGIDSSLIALIADHLNYADLNTVSITFREADYNEEPYQKEVLNRMRPHNHQSYMVDGKMFMEQLDDVFAAMDQPSLDGVNSYFVSQCAHRAGLKTVLSGLGGDEIFGGYPSFERINTLKALRLIPRKMFLLARYLPDSLSRLSYFANHSNFKEYWLLRGLFNESVISQITGQKEKVVDEMLSTLSVANYPKHRDKNLASFLETNIYMENQLLKDTDYMSMWHSLEVRVPFLDKEVMKIMCSIDPKIKFNNKQPKYLLTKTFEDLLPHKVVYRKKQGFTFPFNIWLKDNINHFIPMLPQTSVTKGIVQNFMAGKVHWSWLWSLIVYKRFLGDKVLN